MTAPSGFEPVDTGPGLVESLWRFRGLIAATVVFSAAAGYGLSLLLPTQYEARAELILADPSATSAFQDAAAGRDLSRYVRNEAEYVLSTAVLTGASGTLERVGVEELRETVTAVAANDVDLLTVSARRPTAQEARDVAHAVASAYQDAKLESARGRAEETIGELQASGEALQAEVDRHEAALEDDPDNSALRAQRDAAIGQLVTLESRIAQIDINAALFGSGVANYEEPELPREPASPRPLRNATALGILGLLASGAFAWWRTETSPLADGRHDPAQVLDAPLLGEIPDFDVTGEGEFPVLEAPHSVVAESYHFIVSALDFALEERGASTVLITSPTAGDGKTITAVNIAAAASTDGRRVLVVDADERRRRITRMSERGQHLGLVDLARSEVTLDNCIVDWSLADGTSVELLPAGRDSEGAAAFFRSSEFNEAMLQVRTAADLVLVDSPPVLAVSETADISEEVEGVVVVVRQGTPLAALEDVRSRLGITHTPILGYVFNRAVTPRFDYSRYSNYYSSRYGYAYEKAYATEDLRGRRKR